MDASVLPFPPRQQSSNHTVGLPAVVKTQSAGYLPRLVAAGLFVGSLPPGSRGRHEHVTKEPLTCAKMWTATVGPGTHLDLLGTTGFLCLSDGGGGEKLGLDPWLELCGGCVGHFLLLLRCRRSCLDRHLLSSNLKETPLFTRMFTLWEEWVQSPEVSHLLLNGSLPLLCLSCFLLGSSSSSRLLLLLYLKELLNLHLGEGRSQDRPTWNTWKEWAPV